MAQVLPALADAPAADPVAAVGDDPPARRSWTRAHLQAAVAQPFDLRRDVLHRWVVVRVERERHALAIVLHHMIADGYALRLLLEEWIELYNAARAGRGATLAPKRADFFDLVAGAPDTPHQPDADFAARMRATRPLRVPGDGGAAQRTSNRGANLWFRLGDARLARLRRTAAALRATPFMILAAALQEVLALRCGQSEVALFAPVANRVDADSQQVFGNLFNTVVLHTRVDPRRDAAERIARVRDACAQAFLHLDIADDALFRLLPDGIVDAQWRLRGVEINQLGMPDVTDRIEGARTRYLRLHRATTQFDLAFALHDDGDGWLNVSYAAELFTAGCVRVLVRDFVRRLDGWLA